jgi:hypothetical protein
MEYNTNRASLAVCRQTWQEKKGESRLYCGKTRNILHLSVLLFCGLPDEVTPWSAFVIARWVINRIIIFSFFSPG